MLQRGRYNLFIYSIVLLVIGILLYHNPWFLVKSKIIGDCIPLLLAMVTPKKRKNTYTTIINSLTYLLLLKNIVHYYKLIIHYYFHFIFYLFGGLLCTSYFFKKHHPDSRPPFNRASEPRIMGSTLSHGIEKRSSMTTQWGYSHDFGNWTNIVSCGFTW